MFKKYSKEVFLLILVSLLLISISAISAGDVSNSTTTSPTVTVEKQVSMSNVIKEDTTDNKVLSKNSENIQTKEKTDNKKTIKKETSNVDYYVCDNSGSDSNTGSQDSPFKTIGYAVGKVNSNDNYNIHIKNGTYKGTGNTNLTIDGNKYINFIGDGINQTIIDGESEYTIQGGTVWGDDPYFNTYNITKGNWAMNITSGNGKITIKNLNFQHMVSKGGNNINAYPTATIDNYANLEVDNVYFYENLAGVGAGIRSNDGSTLVVNNSIFESNRKSSSTGNFGAGIYNNGTATIHNSQFIDNAARWGTVTNDKVLTIVNSTFRNGHAYNLASTFKFGSGIAANTGSADFYNQHNGSVTLITNITKCTFENNEQTDIYQGKGNLYVNECVFKNSTGIYIANENTYNNSMKHVIENSNFTDMQPSTILLSFFDRTTPTFAIYNLGQYNTTIRNNQITTNIGSHALYLKGYNNITNNNIEGFIYITGKNNTLTDNTLKYNKTYVVELTSSAYNNTITDNSITASIFTGDRAVKTANNENTIENNTINTGSDYTITEANYNDFFDTNGDIKNVPTGSKLTLQTLNNKQFNIKNVNVYITNDNTSILNNCSIYVDNTAKVTIYGLNIQNTNNKDYVIKVNSKDNTIEANNITVNTNTPIHTITITDDRNTIYNNTIITNGPSNNITYTDNYGIADTIGLLIQSSNNIVELNKITTINTTTQPYGTINGISIQNKTNRHTNNLIRNNTITTQTNDYAYSINLQNTDENIIIGNNITTTSNNYANGIQLIDSNKNYINAKINITATNNAYGVVISGINTIPADNNITVNMNLTANNVYGVDLYNTNNTIITSNDSTSPYYLYGNSIMVNMYKANYTDISFLTPYQNGTSTAFNVINSSNVAINGINYTQQTNGIKYNTGTYTQITNSTDVYIGILVKGNYTENATINTPKTPIQITNSQLININGLKITTTLKHTILLTNTNNSIIQNNILKSSEGNGDATIQETRCFNNSLINNTGPDNTNTINLKSLKNKQQIKSIKKAEENIILTEENYDQYFTNGEIKSGIKKITLGSDLYNKNMTIGNDLIEINNYLHKYTLYNTTIIYKHNVTLNNITIINTDEREATFILSSTLKPFEMYGNLYHLDIRFNNCTIIQKNKGDSVLFKEESNATANINLRFSRIIMEGNKAIVINFTNSPYDIRYCKINVKTNVSTPVLLENLEWMCGCIIIVDEPEDQPIIVSRAEYAQQECYLLTPFRRGSSAMEGDPWDNLPAAGNNTLPIYTTITNKELKVGKINDINIKVVDVWLKDVNEGNITVKINNDIIGTVPVTNGSATVQYSPQEEANYTIVLDYQTNTENYVQYDWIGDHSGGGMCRFKPCNDSFIIDAVIPITTIIIEPTVAQINDTISISASVTSDNTPITGGRVIFKVRDKILKDINGNVLFANVKDGKAVINNYTIPGDWIKPNTKMTAVYSGTSTIQSASSTIDLDISKIMPEIELEPQTVEVGKEVTLIAKVTSKQTTYSSDNNTLITSDTNKETITKPVNGGRVVFKINGRTLRDSNGNIIYGNVVDGIASITYTVPDSFTPKNYNITCVYGNKLYERNEGNTILTVKTNTKKIATKSLKTLTDTRIELSGETQVTIGGDTVITAKLVDATGNAINGVKISGYLGDTFISEESPTENGEVEFWIQNSVLSEARDYTFTAKSEETTEYAASTNSTIISVNKVETELTINEPLDIVVDVNTPVTINGTLTNATGGAIANAIINLNITDVGSVTNTTGSDGKYSYTWIPSKKGTFYVNATYDGNDKYGDAFASTYGDVDPLTTTITLNIKDGDEFLVNTPITISGTILDNNNNPPEHVLLTIRFNKRNIIISAENGSYSHTTSYDQTPKYPRLYELSVEYAGNDTYNGDKITVTINVTSKMKTMMSVDEGPIDVVVTDNVTINGTLTDEEGMPIEGAEIEVSTGDLITTNSTGGYSYTYKADTVGENIPITFKYYGNKTYESTSAETSINVLKLNTTLRLTGTTQYTYGMPVIIKVNLTDAKGNPISDASIDGTISNMEGITTIITGNDGTAEFYITDLPVSEYTLTATYAGTDTKYNGNTTDIIFEINKLGTILSINPELENIDVNTQKTINGTLTDVNGNVLNGVNITMSITGMEEFNLTTDNNGKYSYTWTPTTVGTYTVKVIYDGSKIYEDAYNDTFFDVEPLSSTITVNVKNSDELRVDSPLNINGTLMDNNNNPIADATLTIIFNGVSTNVNTDKDGLYKFDTTTPSYAGLYDLTVEYAGNDTYNGDEKTVKLDVKKISTDITVNKQETVLVPLDNIVINGTLTDEYNMPMKDAEITIAITGENNITVKTNDEGKYTYTYKTTKEGIYNVVVLYEGNDKYYESSANTSFNVEKIDSSITIDTIGSVDANSNVNVTGILVDSAQNAISNQEVTITVNNKKYTTTTGSDGKYVVTIMSPVVTGHYDVSASYAGSDVYTMASAQTSMFVKEETGITAEGPISATVNSTITINGTLMDASDNGIANATITVVFEGKDYTTTTNGDGKFTCDIMTTTVGDNIPVTVRYDGNDTYMASSEIISVDVEKLGSELTLNPVNNTDINSTVDVSGLLSEEYTQKAIANSTVTIIVDGISYNTVTDDNGNFKVTIKAAATTGTYTIKASYDGSDLYTPSSDETTFDVEKISSSITIDAIGSVDANSNVNVTGILVDSAQNAISNQEVTITVNNKKYTTTTDNEGKYVVTIMTSLASGNYDVSASYAGSDVYTMASTQTSMFVKEETSIIAEGPISATVNSTITINGTLIDTKNNGIANATITVVFEGKDYTTTTNGDGKFTCDIMTTTVGDNIPVTVRYDGNDTYMASSEIISVDVEKLGSELTLNPVNNTDINSTVDVSGVLSEEYTQKAIANSTVTIIVDGISYNTVTDDNGNFKVTIKAAATTGTYTIKASYDGSDLYTPSSDETTFDVEKISTKTTVDAVNGVIYEKVNLTAHITDVNGNNVTGGKVVFSINGVEVTDNNGNVIYANVTGGVATITKEAPRVWHKENTTIVATYLGNDAYDDSVSEKADVIITLRTANIDVLTNGTKVKVGDTTSIIAHVYYNNTLVNEGKVIFKLNGKTLKDDDGNIIFVKVENGIAKLDYTITSIYSAKEYTLTAVFSGKDYNRVATESHLTVLRTNTHIQAEMVNITSNNATVSLKIFDEKNNLINRDTKVTVKVNGKTVYNQIIVSNGVANLNLNLPVSSKPYNITIISGENSVYATSTTSFMFKNTVKIPTKVTATAKLVNNKTATVSVKINDNNNKPVTGNTKVVVKLNGKTQANAIAVNGVADIDMIPPTIKGTYTLVVMTGETSIYEKATTTTTLKV